MDGPGHEERSRMPEGVYFRGRVLWIRYSAHGTELREPTAAKSPREASRIRGQRLAEYERGERTTSTRTLRGDDLCDAVLRDYELNGYRSMRTAVGHCKALRLVIRRIRATDVTTDVVERMQQEWQRAGLTNASINRRCNILRRGFRLLVRAKKLAVVPYIPRLREHSPRGRYITPGDFTAIRAQLPAYLRPVVAFAYDDGIRKGQLARTRREYVDLERAVIAWPAGECKREEPHVVPLEDGGTLDIVRSLMAAPPAWCPYLFHGPRCVPGRAPSRQYGCLGDFKKAWATACAKAGFPVGRSAGGYVFHHTRNSAVTNLVAAGIEEGEAMKVTGHTTAHVFRHYDVGNVEALRQKLARRRAYVIGRPVLVKGVGRGTSPAEACAEPGAEPPVIRQLRS